MRKGDPAALPAGAELRADRRFVEALARELALLRCCAVARRPDRGLGNSETAARTGLPAATVSHLTFTLTSLGCLICAPERARSALGTRHRRADAGLSPAVAQHHPVRLSWARLLKRVFEIELEHCPNCGGELKIIAAILRGEPGRKSEMVLRTVYAWPTPGPLCPGNR